VHRHVNVRSYICRHLTSTISILCDLYSSCGLILYLASVDFNHVVLRRPLLGVPSTLPCSAVFAIRFSSIRLYAEPFVLSLMHFLHNRVSQIEGPSDVFISHFVHNVHKS